MNKKILYIVCVIIATTLNSCDMWKIPFIFEKNEKRFLNVVSDSTSMGLKMEVDPVAGGFFLRIQAPCDYQINGDSLGVMIHTCFGSIRGRVKDYNKWIENDSSMCRIYILPMREDFTSPDTPYFIWNFVEQVDLHMPGTILRNGKSIVNDTLVMHRVYPDPKFRLSGTKKLEKLKKIAGKTIPAFSSWNTSATYPIYDAYVYENLCPEFDQIPTIWELNPFLDYSMSSLAFVLTKKEENIWRLEFSQTNHKKVHHELGGEEDYILFDYLETTDPDRVYRLYGLSECYVIEKGYYRYTIRKVGDSYQECQLSDLFASPTEFNTLIKEHIPNKKTIGHIHYKNSLH